jgi:hypothetical protein
MRYVILFSLFAIILFESHAQVNYSKQFALKSSNAEMPGLSTGAQHDIKATFSKTCSGVRSKLTTEKNVIRTSYQTKLKNGEDRDEAKNTLRTDLKAQYNYTMDEFSVALNHFLIDRAIIFPARNRFLTRYYYTQNKDFTVNAISNNYFNINPSTSSGSIFSEIIAGYLSIARISLGGMVSKADLEQITGDEIQNLSTAEIDSLVHAVDSVNALRTTAQNILGGGGNIVINVATPVLHYSSFDETFVTTISLFDRIGFAIPGIGTVQNVGEFTNQIGVQGDAWLNLDFMDSGPFAIVFRASAQIFTNKAFAQELGYTNQKSFAFSELGIAIEIDQRFRIGGNIPFLLTPGGNEDAFKPTIAVTVMPF